MNKTKEKYTMAELAPGSVTTFNDIGGSNDPSTDKGGATPSDKTAKKGKPAPSPYFLSNPSVPIIGSPVMGNPVVTDQLHLGGWKIYIKDNKMYASDGLHELQFVMINPAGLTQTSKPNKLSDGSDGSTEGSAGNTAISGRTVPSNSGTTNVAGSNGVPGGANVDNVLRTIRQIESTNNYTAQAKTSSASGAYQFIDGTWKNLSARAGFGNQYARAKDAPPAIQDAVARYYVNDILQRSGGDFNAVPNEWFTGNINGNMTAKQQAANPTVTSATYRNRFWSAFNTVNGTNNTALAYTDTPSNSLPQFASLSPGQGFPPSQPDSVNTQPGAQNTGQQGVANASGGTGDNATSPVQDLANSGINALGGQAGQILTTVPCVPNEIQQALNSLKPGGLTGLVMDVTKSLKDLSDMTKKITQLLPGVPFSATGQIIQTLISTYNDITGVLKLVESELTSGLNKIIAELDCITKDINAVSSGINSVINSWTNIELIKILPDNLSIDDVIDGKANTALVNLKVGDTTNKPAPTVPTASAQPNNEIIATSTQEAFVPVDPEQDIKTVELLQINEEVTVVPFVATIPVARPKVESLIGRNITDEEWSELIAATHACCSDDFKEIAWFVRTITNRCLKSGATIIEVVADFPHVEQRTQKYIYGPLQDSEALINYAIVEFIDGAAPNNYYIDSFSYHSLQLGTTYVAQRKGITGIAVGQSFVYPGAKWP